MKSTYLCVLICSLHFVCVRSAGAQLTNEAINRCVAATVLVEISNNRGFGTAFCIHADGYFVTNRHVVKAAGIGGTVKLVALPGTEKEKIFTATVLEFSSDEDLAVLYASESKGFQTIPLGDDTDLKETMPLTAFGYPYGNLLAVANQKYPNISVNLGHITSLRGDRKEPTLIQTDAQLNPGNSGGPMVTDDGQIIGVITLGLQNTGITLAIPVSRVREMLAKPRVIFEAPSLKLADRYKPIEVSVQVTPLVPDACKIKSVLFELQRGDNISVIRTKRTSGEQYTAAITPLKKPDGPPRWLIELEFADSVIRGLALDTKLEINGQSLKLSELQSLQRIPDGASARTKQGKNLNGKWPNKTLSLRVAGQDLQFNLAAVRRINVISPETSPESIKVAAVITTSGGLSRRVERTLRFGDESSTNQKEIGSDTAREPQSVACASLVAYEGFDYAESAQLNGQNGGCGWNGAWEGTNSFTIGTGIVSKDTNWTPLGHRVISSFSNGNKDIRRNLSKPAQDGKTYIGFLLRPEGIVGQGYDDGHLGLIISSGPITSNDLFIGKPGGRNSSYVIENVGGSGRQKTSTFPISGETTFFVLCAELVEGNDTFRLYLNPSTKSAEPTVANIVKTDLNMPGISSIYVAGSGAFSVDEIRIGLTYDQVVKSEKSNK